MISKIVSLILKMIEGRWVVYQAKKIGLLSYLKFLAVLRTSLLGILFLIFAFQIFVFSIVGIIVLTIYLSPLDTESKAWILLGLCLTLFLSTSGFLVYAFSQKTWLKYSGAKDLMARLE